MNNMGAPNCPECDGPKQYYDSGFASDLSYAKMYWVCGDCGACGLDLFSLEYFDTDMNEEE